MFKQYDNAMETALHEQALDTQQSVEVIAKLVGAVHRHTIAAKTSQVALTTEVNELKQKRKKYTENAKALEKARKKGKTNKVGEMVKDITHGLFDKSPKENPSLKNPSTTTTVDNDEPPPSYEPATEANVTEAELAASKEKWLKKEEEAREEGAIFTRDEEREKMVDQMCYAAVKARQDYEALKKKYEEEIHEKNFNPYISSTPHISSGSYGWPSPHQVGSLPSARPRELYSMIPDSKDKEPLQNLKPEITPVEKRLRIRDMKRVMMPLEPGQEIAWATIMEQVVSRGIPGEEALALQALIPQLTTHSEVAAQATSLLVQAAGKPYKEREALATFFNWIRSKYQLSPRKKREIFSRKIREMRWDWRSNPADKITSILTEIQLTWEEVVNQPALREELEAAFASKLNITLQLEITQRSPEEWKQAITEVWESVKNTTSLEVH